MTGKPKYGCLKENSIAFESCELPSLESLEDFTGIQSSNENRACSQIDHQRDCFHPEDSKILPVQMSCSQSLEKEYLLEIRKNWSVCKFI